MYGTDQVGEPEDEGRGCSALVGNLPYLMHIAHVDVTKMCTSSLVLISWNPLATPACSYIAKKSLPCFSQL